jgi:sortase A
MGNRSDRRIFRKRRRRAGFVLFASLGILLLGGLLFSSLTAAGRAAPPVEWIQVPLSASAPEAVEKVEEKQPEQAAGNRATEDKAVQEKAAEKEAAQEAKPPPPDDPTTFLTVPRLGLYDNTVRNSSEQWALDAGAAKIPSTGFPWQSGANTYIAGHRIGWPGTESDYQFYNLPSMQMGDPVYLTDMNGTVYTYQVSEVFAVYPSETWVSNPIAGRDMITLQTCTETPNDWWTIGPKLMESGPDSGRLIVRADKVATDYAV